MDDMGEQLHPHVINALRSRWNDKGQTYQGMSMSLKEDGSGLKLTLYFKTSHEMADMPISSIVTLFDELEDALKNGRVNLKADFDTKEKSRREIDRIIE